MKHKLKSAITRYLPERTFEEVAVHARVLLYTTIPNAVLPHRKAKLRQAQRLRSLKLNIGCGPDNPPDWFGIDFLSREADLRCDIRLGIPLQAESCRCIFAEHVFEHFDRRSLRFVLRECYRVLEPGGSIRLVVPDLGAYIRAYVENNGVFSSLAYTTQGHLSAPELLNDVFYVTTHRWIHDFESLSREMASAGFAEIERSDQNCSRFEHFTIDNPENHRKAESLYVEAVKH